MSRRPRTAELAASLPLTTITPDGLAILDNGTLIRAVRLEAALTPLRMSSTEMERTNRAVQEIPALLPDRQALQLITTARPFDWTTEVDRIQATTAQLNEALAADGLGDRAGALSRLAVAGAEALVEQAERLSAMDLEHLLIMPWKPRRSAGSKRQHPVGYFAETVEDLDARFRQIVTHLDTLGLAPKPLDGEQFATSLYRALNPTSRPPADLASLLHDPACDADEAFDHAYDLRQALCATEVDDSSRTYLRAGEHIIQSRALSSTPEHTWLGWLLHLAQSPYPFTLSVRWEAGTRTRERSKARAALQADLRASARQGDAPEGDRLRVPPARAGGGGADRRARVERGRRDLPGRGQPHPDQPAGPEDPAPNRGGPPGAPRAARQGAATLDARARAGGPDPHRRAASSAVVRAAGRVALHLAAGDRRARTQAPLRHPEPRRHHPAGQRALRLTERDPARLGAPGPHAGQARPATTRGTTTTS